MWMLQKASLSLWYPLFLETVSQDQLQLQLKAWPSMSTVFVSCTEPDHTPPVGKAYETNTKPDARI